MSVLCSWLFGENGRKIKLDLCADNGVFPEWSRTFTELREFDKSLKLKLGTI